jgi:hypothetical protein
MRVLVHVRGTVDVVELWPYVSRAQPYSGGSLLDFDVLDGRELVSTLVALLDRGLEIVKVESFDPNVSQA